MGDQPFSYQTGHQFICIVHPAATVMTESVHEGVGDVVCTGRAQAGKVRCAYHQKNPCRNHEARSASGPAPP